MAHASFGLILANRAVVLGAIQARDLHRAAAAGRGARAPSTRSGSATACWPSRASRRWRCCPRWPAPRRGCGSAVGCMATFVHRHPAAVRAAVGEPRRALGRARAGSRSAWAGPTSRAPRRRSSTRAMGVALERAGGPDGGGHPDPPEGLQRREGLAPGRVLPVRGRRRSSRGPSSSRARSGSRATRPASPGRAGPAPPTRRWSAASAGWPATRTAG